MQFGYIYVLENESMPGLYKIGYTDRNPQDRAKELYNTPGVPTPFFVTMSYYVFNPQKCESIIHKHLDQYRVNKSREFFKADLNVIKNAFKHLFDIFSDIFDKFKDAYELAADQSYKETYLETLDYNYNNIRKRNYKLETYKDVFKKNGNYYIVKFQSVFCHEEQYKEWLKFKISALKEHKLNKIHPKIKGFSFKYRKLLLEEVPE